MSFDPESNWYGRQGMWGNSSWNSSQWASWSAGRTQHARETAAAASRREDEESARRRRAGASETTASGRCGDHHDNWPVLLIVGACFVIASLAVGLLRSLIGWLAKF